MSEYIIPTCTWQKQSRSGNRKAARWGLHWISREPVRRAISLASSARLNAGLCGLAGDRDAEWSLCSSILGRDERLMRGI